MDLVGVALCGRPLAAYPVLRIFIIRMMLPLSQPFLPDKTGHFAPDDTGHFAPDDTGHFAPDDTGHFAHTILRTFGEPGRAWLAELPALLEDCCRRWSLRLGEPFPLSFNYVTAAITALGAPVVLKLGVPNPELYSEMAALRLYDGQGAVRLLDSLPEQGALLLERAVPGSMLSDASPDDDENTRILARAMRRLWRPLSPAQAQPFSDLRRWTMAIPHQLETNPASGGLPRGLLEHAAGLLQDLLVSQGETVLLHGDLHHDNLLWSRRSEREEWLVIDPKGLAGEREFEVGPLMYNPWQRILEWQDLKSIYARRLDILVEELGLDRQRMLAWSFVEAVLSIVWLMEDGTPDWQRWLRVPEALWEID